MRTECAGSDHGRTSPGRSCSVAVGKYKLRKLRDPGEERDAPAELAAAGGGAGSRRRRGETDATGGAGQCVWMIWSRIIGWELKSDNWEDMGWVEQRCEDGSDACEFQGEEPDKCTRVGREEEGTCSNRPELGAVVLALQSAALSEDVMSYCAITRVLCVIKKWVGQGGKATFATAPDVDLLREIVCLLTQRVRAGRATFLVKVK